MKSRQTRLWLLIVALALTAQLSFVSAPVRAQNANSSTMAETPQNDNTGIPINKACARRCRRAYSTCLRRADGNAGRRRACWVRYRNCLRRCPQ